MAGRRAPGARRARRRGRRGRDCGRGGRFPGLIAIPILGELLLKTTTPITLRLLLADPYLHREVVTPELAEQYACFLWTLARASRSSPALRGYDADRAALRPRLSHVAAPTLIIWTDADPYFPLSAARELLTLLPDARLEVVHDAGHLPQEEQPTEFTRLVLSWLNPASTPLASLD